MTVIVAGVVVWYVATTDIPELPDQPAASTVYYADGQTVLARVGVVNRTDTPLEVVPQHLRDAVIAAEDRAFYHHNGISSRGVARAAWSNVVDGDGQGASTITQQYVRNAYLTQDRTLRRKTREAALALRVEQRFTKDELLGRYLNTIYYGRGAYGIQAAAAAYFGMDVQRLTLAQGIVLAAVIKDPTGFDPVVAPQAALERWRWILAAMVELGQVDRGTAGTLRYPEVLPDGGATAGPVGLVVDQVERELARRDVPAQLLRTGGLRVVTTIDETTQRSAVAAVDETMRGQPDTLRTALVAIDPATGAVRAYYGGARGRGFFDDASAARPPASAFLPVILAEALRQGIEVTSRWDGPPSCDPCPLSEAMTRSLVTPYRRVAKAVGPQRVAELAFRLGVSRTYGGRRALTDPPGGAAPGRTTADIADGRYPVSPIDLATVYAGLAGDGAGLERHFVDSVRGGSVTWSAGSPKRDPVLPETAAAQVTAVLVAAAGPGLLSGRPVAGKTGAYQWEGADNQDAWQAGYTRELAAVVWVGRQQPGPIRDATGRPVTGDTLPRVLWQRFMTATLAGRPPQAFPPGADLGGPGVGRPLRTPPATRAATPHGTAGPHPTGDPGGGTTTGPDKKGGTSTGPATKQPSTTRSPR